MIRNEMDQLKHIAHTICYKIDNVDNISSAKYRSLCIYIYNVVWFEQHFCVIVKPIRGV